MYYLEQAESLIKNNTEYPKQLSWKKKGSSLEIPLCINSLDAYKTVCAFAKDADLDVDKILALVLLLLSLIPIVNEPKAIAEYSIDYNGVYDFQFIIDDFVKVLTNKKPTSRPKNDKKQKKYVPVYKQIKSVYTFGLEYDPKTKLMRLRYKLYPQKHWWGFRYEERLRSFEDLLSFVVRDLVPYHNEEQVEISVPDDPEEEKDTFEEF